jgi:hypothetical protein
VTGETEEVRTFGGLQLQSATDRAQDMWRNANIPALLEPCVPGEADTGEIGKLLPAEARRATAVAVLEADSRW